MDERINRLADTLVNYSCGIEKGEKVLIQYDGAAALPLVKQLIRRVYAAGGLPFVNISDSGVTREMLMGIGREQVDIIAAHQLAQMKQMDAYIAVRASDNPFELSDVPADRMEMYYSGTKDVLDYRVDHTKWVVLRYPNPSMAQMASMSLEAFSDFYFDVCTMDYSAMSAAMDALVELMNRTDRVRLSGEGTDLSFSIKGMPAVKCAGEMNIPDGEVYTAPVRDSLNGVITYNTPSEEQGFTYENIRFEVKDGRIVKATANDTERINRLLDTDEGARYFGEFALGVNPYITRPMKDTLFDEKISGSFHLTPGMCYEDAPNGNDSAIHWDLVMIQRPEFGGGEIRFDDRVIRRDGRFIIPELEGLNPENLKKR